MAIALQTASCPTTGRANHVQAASWTDPIFGLGDVLDRIRPPGVIDFVLLPVLYYAGAKLGMLTVMPEGMAILWLPNGALLAALLRFQAGRYVIFAALAIGAEIAADW